MANPPGRQSLETLVTDSQIVSTAEISPAKMTMAKVPPLIIIEHDPYLTPAMNSSIKPPQNKALLSVAQRVQSLSPGGVSKTYLEKLEGRQAPQDPDAPLST